MLRYAAVHSRDHNTVTSLILILIGSLVAECDDDDDDTFDITSSVDHFHAKEL